MSSRTLLILAFAGAFCLLAAAVATDALAQDLKETPPEQTGTAAPEAPPSDSTAKDGTPAKGKEAEADKEGQDQDQDAPGPFGSMKFLFVMIAIFVLMYFWMGRGRRKQEAKRKEMLATLKKGDKVTSVGGIIGTVVEARDDELVVKIDENNNIRVRFARWAMRGVGETAKTETPEDRK